MASADLESIKVPTQSQLRKLVHLLANDASKIEELDLVPEQDEEADDYEPMVFSPEDIFQELQGVTGQQRDQIWRLASAIVPTPSEEKFTSFTQLPFELRDKIWKFAAQTENAIELTWQYNKHRWWTTTFCRVAPPAVFSTCSESRESTQCIQEKEMIKAFGTHFNLYTDLLLLQTLDDEILNRRFMNFCMDLYEVWNSDGEAVRKLPRLAIGSDMWEEMVNVDSEDENEGEEEDDLSVGGKSGLLRMNFTGLRELFLVQVLEVLEQRGELFRDERVLVEEELLSAADAYGKYNDHLVDHEEALGSARENLKYEADECEVSWKVLYRGDDGEGGARAEFKSENPGLYMP